MTDTNPANYGQLVPQGGGDPIPLLRKKLRVGRREGCDIVLSLKTISSHHCLLELDEGYWFIRDLNSRNGIKVNGTKILGAVRKRVDPGDEIHIAKNIYICDYDAMANGAFGPPPQDGTMELTFESSLLEVTGIKKKKR